MARKMTEDQPAVRKGLLITCGAAIGAALLGFILINFVLGGHGAGTAPTTGTAATTTTVGTSTSPLATATPQPVSNEITPGGRDPFSAPLGIAPVASPPAAAAPAAPTQTKVLASSETPQHFSLFVAKVTGHTADIKFDDKPISGVNAGDTLPDGVVVKSVGDGCASFSQGGQTFSVCQGQTVQR
jgi:hypothetical protein